MAETDTVAVTFSADIRSLMAGMRTLQQEMEKLSKASKRAATDEEKAMKAREVAARKAQKSMEALHRTQMQTARGMGAGMMSTLGQWAAGFGMTAGFVKAIDDIKEFDAALTDLRINGDKSASWAHKMESAINKVSLATGRGRMETLEYARAIIVQTGNAEVAMATLKDMGDVALATGADFKSLGGVAVKLTGAMGIAGTSSDFRKAFGVLHSQGKMGSIEFKAQSGELGRLFATSAMMGGVGKGMAGVAGVGALFQLAARGKTPDQAGEVATSLERFLEHLARDPSKVQSEIGAQVGGWSGGAEVQKIAAQLATTKNGMKRRKLMDAMAKAGGRFEFLDLETIARNIGEAGVRDPTKFAAGAGRAFGIEGIRVAQQLALAAKGGWGANQGSMVSASALFGAGSGSGMMRDALRGSNDVIARDAEIRRKSLSNRWDVTMQKFAHTMHTALLPIFEELVKKGPVLASIFKFMAQNLNWLVAAAVTAKTVGAFGRWGGTTGSAAATAGAGGALAGAGFSMGRAAANAFAFAPAMMALGVKLGEMFAGTTIAKTRKAEDDARNELKRGKANLKAYRGASGAAGFARMLTKEWEATAEGGRSAAATSALLGGMTGPALTPGGPDMPGQLLPGVLSIAGITSKGREATDAALSAAQSQHSMRVRMAEDAARMAGMPLLSTDEIDEMAMSGGTPEEKISIRKKLTAKRERQLSEVDPTLAALTPVLAALEKAASDFAQGKQPIDLHVTVQAADPTEGRAQAAAGKPTGNASALKLAAKEGKAKRDFQNMLNRGGDKAVGLGNFTLK